MGTLSEFHRWTGWMRCRSLWPVRSILAVWHLPVVICFLYFYLSQDSILLRDLVNQTPASPDSKFSIFQFLVVISDRALGADCRLRDLTHHVPVIGNRHMDVCTIFTAGARRSYIIELIQVTINSLLSHVNMLHPLGIFNSQPLTKCFSCSSAPRFLRVNRNRNSFMFVFSASSCWQNVHFNQLDEWGTWLCCHWPCSHLWTVKKNICLHKSSCEDVTLSSN